MVGGPSVGKSSAARAIQRAGGLRDSWVLAGDRHLLRLVLADQLVRYGHPVDADWEGWSVPYVDGRVVGRPIAGRRALRLLDGMYRAAGAMTLAGNNVVVEDVVWEAKVAAMALDSVRAIETLVVRLVCPFVEAVDRERARRGRFDGAVAAYASEPELIADVDLSLDSSVLDPDAIARRILDVLDARNDTTGVR